MAMTSISITGLHLLFLLHAAYSFVLLTANIEDVKKIAMKFVSESLAEKIATFLTETAQHMMNQGSAEVQKDVSEENREYIKEDSSNEQDKTIRRKPKMSKEVFRQFEEKSRYAQTAIKNQPGQYSYTLRKDDRLSQPRPNIQDAAYQLKFRASNSKDNITRNAIKEDIGANNNESITNKEEENETFSDCSSIEDNTLDSGKDKNNNLDPVNKNSSKAKSPEGNKKHVSLVATSGHVKLMRITTDRPQQGRRDNEKINGNKEVKMQAKEYTWF